MQPLDRMTRIMVSILLPLAVATGVGLMALWPTGEPPATGVTDVDVRYPTGRVLSVDTVACAGTTDDRLADGTIPAAVACLRLEVEVLSGVEAGRLVEIWAPPAVAAADLRVGTHVVLAHYVATPTEPEVWAWYDFARSAPLLVLAGAFALVVIAVARMRGLRALIGLAIAFVVIGAFMLPALLRGTHAFAVGLVGSMAIMFVVLYLAHGVSLRTSVAMLGTFAGLTATAVLGVIAAHATRITGLETEEAYRLAQITGNLGGQGLRGLFLAGVVLAGLGVLNDVTITQASAVWELRASDPKATWRTLFARGMRIGRDHIASTVYTIAFAYAGAALPIMLLLEVYRMPLWQTVTSGAFAEEIARTLVGSIGLVLAIPLTTLIAALVVTSQRELPPDLRRRVERGDPVIGHHAH